MHGGDIYTEGLLKGKTLIDFSSNINPKGVPESFKSHIAEGFQMVERYPDIKYRSLKKDLIYYNEKYFDLILNEEDIVLGNGASEIIDLVLSSLKKVVLPTPSFSEYSLSIKKWGGSVIHSSLNENMDYDYLDILEKLKKAHGLVIGNPNNPNGGIIDIESFIPILDYCEDNEKVVIIDEAFIEMNGYKGSLIKLIEKYKSLFIIRALTKFFGVPGIRMGYGVTRNNVLLNYIRERQNPWNINSFAELCTHYVLYDEEYIKDSLKWIEEERIYFISELNKLSIIDKVYDTKSNYCLCKLKDISDEELYRYCLNKGVLIRRASNFQGLDNSYVRFAIKNRELNNILINILRNIPR
ncbi:histidinol-phosphate transaminase [Clostridium sp.]|uniref:histidinol-phosphate transaminase n=1 Tax=Clostridium sp. TaxID=1506 RepID=UPI0034639D16